MGSRHLDPLSIRRTGRWVGAATLVSWLSLGAMACQDEPKRIEGAPPEVENCHGVRFAPRLFPAAGREAIG